VRNWTHIQTLRGYPLAGLAIVWLLARLAGWMIPGQVLPMMVMDLLFDLWLIFAIFGPILRAKQYDQIGIASKLVLLLLSNLVFYLGVTGRLDQGITWGLYSGLYFLLALVFTMARRVLPFFIERGVGHPVKLINRKWIDLSSLVLFVLFLLADVFWRNATAAAVLAALLFVTHVIRLRGWYDKGIWAKPLLWVLYLGYCGAVLGFLLKALVPFLPIPPDLAIHAFAVGGVGMVTAGMMARVALGHTGRDIQRHSRLLAPAFMFLLAAFLARVILPIFAPGHFMVWVGTAQAAWLIAFALFVLIYFPILIKARVDGMPG